MADLSIFKLDNQTITIKDTTARQAAESAKAEVQDIRVKADGTTAASAGNAVREQITELKNDLDAVEDIVDEIVPKFPSNYTTVNIGALADGALGQRHNVSAVGDTFRHSDDISVSAGEIYRLTCKGNTTFCPFMFFNKSGSSYTLVATYYTISGDTATGDKVLTNYIVTVPDGANTLCLNVFLSASGQHLYSVEIKTLADITNIPVEISDLQDEKVDKYGVTQVTPNNTTFFDEINLFDRLNSTYTNIWASTDGVIRASTGTKNSIIIPVEPDTKYAIRIPSPNRQIFVESDTGEFIIGQTYPVMTFLSQSQEWRVVQTASTTKAIMWTFYDGSYDYEANVSGFCLLKSDTIPSDNLIPTPTIKIVNLPTKILAGKTAVIFGTSITSDAKYGIPKYIRNITGLTLTCESLGSSCARRGWASRETANDPYGWTGVAWQNVFLAMGASLAEKQDLINNYVTKWADLIGGDFDGSNTDGTGTGKPEEITEYWENRILAASYENKLIPYLDGTKDMPDLFIFEHGHNDYEANMSGLVADENDLDMSTYGGAMYFYFKKIFEANPQAKIMVLSHYEKSSAKGKTIFDAMEQLADYHGVAFCNVADALAWSQRLVTTTGYWNQSTHLWIPSGGTSRTITRRQQALFDDLHPHNDWSGNASKREASIISDYLISSRKFLFD